MVFRTGKHGKVYNTEKGSGEIHQRPSIDQLRREHAEKLFQKNGDIIQALKAKHGDKNLHTHDIFREGSQGKKHLETNAKMIAKYSLNNDSGYKALTPISLHKIIDDEPTDYERSDGNWIQKYLYKGSGKIIEMSPDEFLKLASPVNTGMKYDPKTQKEYRVSEPKRFDEKYYSEESIKHLRDNLGKKEGEIPNFTTKKVGDKLQILGHEGRHRAFVAREKGIKKIPVMVATDHSDNPLDDTDIKAIESHNFIPENT